MTFWQFLQLISRQIILHKGSAGGGGGGRRIAEIFACLFGEKLVSLGSRGQECRRR